MEGSSGLWKRQSPRSATAPEDNSPSLSTLVSTLVPILVISGVTVLAFLILRRVLHRNYVPRTFLGALRDQEQSPALPTGLFNWIGKFNQIPDTHVLNHHTIDGFLLLRYLKISATICFVGCLITWPILFPVNATGGGGQKQLNLLSFSNVVTKNRYYAHTFVAWAYFSFVFYMVARESIYYINLRQAYLLAPLYASRMSSRTVLFASLPKPYQNEAVLRRMYGPQVKNIWIANECNEIEELVEERDKVAFKLEAAETKLIKLANAARLKAAKKGTPVDSERTADTQGESGSVAARFLQPKQRPTHRLKPLIGKKVDTINWCRSELQRLIPKIESVQAKYRAGDAEFLPACFIEFYRQADAQAAFQSLAHHQALHMVPRYIGIPPDQVIWKNLKITWSSRVIRGILTTAFVSALIIFWAIPVAAVGAISNISSLTEKVTFLSFINNVPPVILGVVQGLLPSILLAVLMALLPIILRLMAKLGGAPSEAAVELKVQTSYFIFQVVQVFLITTVSSSAAAVGAKIAQNPSSATTLLAQNLPKASNFYISYLILQGLTISSKALLQIVGVIIFLILSKILDSTPRKMYKRWTTLSGLGWGSVFPVFELLTVIAITYSIIAPLVLGFATIGIYLIYLAYRYNLLFVFNAQIDTQGLVYPKALQHTTTGIYLAIICLIGLFGIQTAIGPLILMVAYLIFAILFHVSLASAIGPLLVYLPRSLQAMEHDIEDGKHIGHKSDSKTDGGLTGEKMTSNGGESELGPAPHKKPNFITKWLKPHVYTDYQTMKRLVPHEFAGITYDPLTERDAYYHPAIGSRTPLLWIPQDNMGISRQECAHSSKIIPMTDEGAHFDEKNKLIWNQESGRPPIYEEKIYY